MRARVYLCVWWRLRSKYPQYQTSRVNNIGGKKKRSYILVILIFSHYNYIFILPFYLDPYNYILYKDSIQTYHRIPG